MFQQIDFTDFLIGLVLGALLLFAWYIFQSMKWKQELILQQKEMEEKEKELEREGAELRGQLKQGLEERHRLEADRQTATALLKEQYDQLSDWKAKAKSAEEKLTFQSSEFVKLRSQFKSDFELLSNQILQEKSERFNKQNEEQLSALLNPLKERIRFFEEEVRKTHLQDSQQRATLFEQFEQFRKVGLQMSEETKRLTDALKGDNRLGGQWGELILESLLEKSGLQKGREFRTQQSFSQEGKILRPDVIIDLPDSKHIVIDSKLSLKAYHAYVSTDNPELKAKALKQHLVSIKAHIDGLSQKNYQQLYELQSLDFVLLFMPLEPAFALGLQNDAELFNRAFERNIIIVSPTTLLATLRTIANLWRQENRNQHAQEIAVEGGRLYDKFVAFVGDLEKIGGHIRQTEQAYEKAFNKLRLGRGNLISRSEKLRKLGARTSKHLPDSLKEDDTKLNP